MAADITLATVAFFFLVAFQVVSTTAASKPNIILFVIDDLGWNDTGYQGADYDTPTLDRLTSEGIRLKQYYVQSLCTPSRGALLAGKYAYTLGLAAGVITNGHPYGLNLSEVTIAEHLKKGGYSTHAVGKWDVGMHKWEYTPTYRGFDTFYGYYNADEDYCTHSCSDHYTDPETKKTVTAKGVDFRNNKEPVTNENSSYSTNLFTSAIERTVVSHDSNSGPFFIYAAYQSVHTPLEVPDNYLKNCASIPYERRQTFCGMMQALDEGINNITETLDKKGYLDNTVLILTTDNGGQTAWGSSNWPLRGNKATVWEGGVRGFSFVWSSTLKTKNYDYTGLMHITDWYRTLIEGIAGIELSDDDTKGLEGYDMWDMVTQNKPSPRNEILLQLNPSDYSPTSHFIGQAAIRVGDWKLITGQPNCSTPIRPSVGDMCPSGWVHLNGTIEYSPPTPSMTWLFNITADPTERNNLAEKYPEVVSKLKERIEVHNSTHIVQMHASFDPKADPKYFNGVWTPWLD